MYHSLLVPLDGSSFAEQALPLAVNIAGRAGAGLQIVRVVPRATDRSALLSALNSQAYLDQVVARLKSSFEGPLTAHVLEGELAAPTLRVHAERTGVDLVVMTTHGRGALSLFWLGSVAYELLDCLPMPTLLVRPRDERTQPKVELTANHVLVALDGSAEAEAILESAVALGTLLNAEYTLLRVVSDLPLSRTGMSSISLAAPAGGVLVQLRDTQHRLREEAQDYLEKIAQPLRACGLLVQTEVRFGSTPHEVILDMASPHDVIAVETHGRHGLSRLVAGSVSRKIIRGAAVPVLAHSAAAVKSRR